MTLEVAMMFGFLALVLVIVVLDAVFIVGIVQITRRIKARTHPDGIVPPYIVTPRSQARMDALREARDSYMRLAAGATLIGLLGVATCLVAILAS